MLCRSLVCLYQSVSQYTSRSELFPQMETYGPISDGVTGSDGGGGRLMSVGVDILFSVIFPSVDNLSFKKV